MAFGDNDSSPESQWTMGVIIMPKTDPNVKLKRSRVEVPEYLHAQLRLVAAEFHIPLASIVEAVLDSTQGEFRVIAEQLRDESAAPTAA